MEGSDLSLCTISEREKKKVLDISKRILETLNIKKHIYNTLITVSQEFALQRLKKITNNSSPIEKKSTGKKIVFNSVHGTFLEAIYKEGGLTKALELRGHNPKMIFCGGSLSLCTGVFTNRIPPSSMMCRNCKYFSKQFFEIIKIPYATYLNYISDQDVVKIKNRISELPLEDCKNFVYKDVNVGFHTMTSLQRFYKGGDPKKTKYIYEHVLRTRLANAIIATEVAEKVLQKDKPEVLVTSHGCYSSWGSFAEYFMNKGIRVVVWYTGYKKNSLIFDLHKLEDSFKIFNSLRRKQPLNKEEEQEITDYLDKRGSGVKEGGDTYYYGFSKKKKDLEKEFEFDKFERTYTIFPNVPWDTSLVNADKAFKDVYDWVSHTIELFKEKPNLQLIVKIHPAEKHSESEETMQDYIHNHFDSLPRNIKIIPPDTDIAPYSLFPYIDVGIVYNGTVGLEMILNDIPVVVAGKIHYFGKGFTYDVNEKKDYDRILFAATLKKLAKEKKELAKAYAYYYFIKSYIPFNILYYRNFLNHGWDIDSFDEFAEGKDKYLDHICKYIIEGGIYQDW